MSDAPLPPPALAPERARPGFWASVRASLAGEQHDFTAERLPRSILLLAVPMVLEMLMESTFALVDVYFVSRLGKEAVAAVGVTEALVTLLYAVAFGLSMSVTAVVARRIGEKDVGRAQQTAVQALILGLACSIPISIAGLLWSEELLALLQASPATIAAGSGYTRILLGTNAVIFAIFLGNAIFRGAGDAALALRALMLANGLNIVLDPCLIFGLGPFPELGIEGAAVATSIGRGSGVIYQLAVLARGRGRLRIERSALRVHPQTMGTLLRLSAGSIGQFLIATCSWVALMNLVGRFGEAAQAGYTIGIRILMFALLPAWGLSNAAATLVGQNLGAGSPERAERATWLTGIYNTAFLGAVTVVMELWPETIAGFITTDPVVLDFAVRSMRLIAAGYVFYAWGMVMVQALNGAGDTVSPTKLNFIFFWLIEVPLAYIAALVLDLGADGVFASIAIAETLFALAAIRLFRRGKWKERRV